MNAKTDFRREQPDLYAPKNRTWEFVEVPRLSFLAIDGAGDPNTSGQYAEAVSALYSIAYPVKFISKREIGRDYVVPPLEGLWYADDPGVFEARDKAAFNWTMLIMVPDWITDEMVDRARDAAAKKDSTLPHGHVRVIEMVEGLCLQVLHVGSYDDEAPTLRHLHHELMPQQGLRFNGHHHEIYLTDPRRTEPSKLRTILRQPVCRPA